MSKGQLKGALTDFSRISAGYGLDERQEKALWLFLNGCSKTDAASQAGYGPSSGPTVFRGAAMQAALSAVLDRFITGELAPTALHTISRLLADKNTAAGVKATLALGILDRAGFDAKRFQRNQDPGKDVSAMSSEELRSSIDKLQAEIEGRMRDVTPNDAPSEPQDIDLFP